MEDGMSIILELLQVFGFVAVGSFLLVIFLAIGLRINGQIPEGFWRFLLGLLHELKTNRSQLWQAIAFFLYCGWACLSGTEKATKIVYFIILLCVSLKALHVSRKKDKSQ